MATQSPILSLPYIQDAQAQKHITHNESIRILDVIVQLSLADRTLKAPPLSPTPPLGTRYLIASPATNEWTGYEGYIATWTENSTWFFLKPNKGWIAFVENESKLIYFNGTNWNDLASVISGGGSTNPTPLVGINTTASNPNKLSIKSDSALFSHDDVTPGSGDIRLKINKSTINKTASFLFQDNWSGRAEIGLTGNDDLHLKVSPDGTNWKDAMIVNKSTGQADFPHTALTRNLLFNLYQDAGRFAGTPEPANIIAGNFVAPNYLSPYNNSTFTSHAKFIHNNSTFGGTAASLHTDVVDLVQKIKSTNAARRNGVEFWVMKITQGNGTSAALTNGSTTRYLSMLNRGAPLWPRSSWGFHIRCLATSVMINDTPDRDTYIDGIKQTSDIFITPTDGWKQVIYVGKADPTVHYEYNVSMYQIYMENSGAALMALPFLIPAELQINSGDIIGRVASLQAWR
jgi:hypothetical protein